MFYSFTKANIAPEEEWPFLYSTEIMLFGILREFSSLIKGMPKEKMKEKLLCGFHILEKEGAPQLEKEKLAIFLDDNITAIHAFAAQLEEGDDERQVDIFWRDTLRVEVFLQCVKESVAFKEYVHSGRNKTQCS